MTHELGAELSGDLTTGFANPGFAFLVIFLVCVFFLNILYHIFIYYFGPY